MQKHELDMFYSDNFRIMLLLNKTTQKINDVSFSPLLYEDIGKSLHITRQTVGKRINELKKAGYVKILMRGRIQITEKGYELLNKLG